MTTDTIKHLGAEFHRAADSLADTLARLDNARLDRLAFLRRCSKDSTARLAAIKEELRTLPEQIAKWDAEAAQLESQTAEDLLRQALETKGGDANATRDNGGARDGESTSSYARSGISPDGLQVDAPSVGKAEGEPFRPGLPPERLRKVWAEWEMVDGVVYVFQGNKYRCTYRPPTEWWDIGAEHTWRASYRPHGQTWAEVEAMADEAEKPTLLDLRTVRLAEDHADPDWVVGDADLFDIDESSPSVEKGQRFQVERVAAQHHGAPRVKIHVGGNQVFIGALQPAHVEPRTPELLDLTKLQPGTVCEATGEIAVPCVFLKLKVGRRFSVVEVMQPPTAEGEDVRVLIGDDTWALPALVPARVVKEGGEQ